MYCSWGGGGQSCTVVWGSVVYCSLGGQSCTVVWGSVVYCSLGVSLVL